MGNNVVIEKNFEKKDINLEKKVNEVIAIEMRANGANYAFTPCINLLRHPGWGRAQETYGILCHFSGNFMNGIVRF